MWTYERRLQYPVNITKTNAEMAKVIITQFGGPDGELAASQRYLSQRYSTQNRKVAGVLTDIGMSVMKLHINVSKQRLNGINRHAEYVISWYNGKQLQINVWFSFYLYPLSVHLSQSGESVYIDHIQSLPEKDAAIMPGTSGYEGSITAKAKDRLQASISLYEAGRVKQIIVSGDEKEIKPMTQYLMKKGIPSESLSSDAHGVDTYDTIARVKEKFGDLSCYFCTQELYSSRAGYLMNRLGVDGAVVNVDTMYYDDAGKNALREFFAATKAVDYARAYAFESNPAYGQFESNCTNFVSQCLVAGGIAMKGKPEISEKNRWDVSGKGTEWYSGAEQCDKDGLTHYSMSETFVKTDAFFEYFTEELGYTLTNYENSYEGNLKCYEEMAAGDVLVLYNEDGTVAHLGLVSGIGEKNAYYCGNTAERRDFSVFTINKETYSKIGILHMSKK